MSFRICLFGCLLALLPGCGWQMAEQPRLDPYEANTLAAEGTSSVRAPSGTVARASDRLATPPLLDEKLLERGRERFTINCAPCHGSTGQGDGRIVERGFPRPPSFHSARLRQADDMHFWSAITNGAGRMYPYAERVSPRDRWAIVAWIRVLQISGGATAQEIHTQLRSAPHSGDFKGSASPSSAAPSQPTSAAPSQPAWAAPSAPSALSAGEKSAEAAP
jgi:mono/diheme cytochrome c family protein